MEDQSSKTKGGSFFLPVAILIVLFVLNLFLAYAVLNPDKLWKNKYFPLDVKGKSVFSYGIAQQLDMKVIDIQDFEDHDGSKGKKFTLSTVLEDGEEKILDKYVLTPNDTLDDFNKTLLYWDPASSSWVSFEELPEGVEAGIAVGDMVTLTYDNYYERGNPDLTVKIQTVEHTNEQ